MPTEALPVSIRIPPEEQHLPWDRLDYVYIDAVARYVANCLVDKVSVEACYQPGDGTCYNLVFVPLVGLATAPPRHSDTNVPWEQHAVKGVAAHRDVRDFQASRNFYAPTACLVTWVGYTSIAINFPINMTADYTGQKFTTSIVSGFALAVLLRAIGFHMEAA